MKTLLTPEGMYACDRAAIEGGTPSRQLMERAARACVRALWKYLSDTPDTPRVLILAGSGNNGGDGLTAAGLLAEQGVCCHICMPVGGDGASPDTGKLSPECKYRYDRIRAVGIPFVPVSSISEGGYTAVLDALFGIGLHRTVEGLCAEAICAVNALCVPVVAVDIPSGVSGATGEILGEAIRATETVTVACPKVGMYRYPGAMYCGICTVAEIGISPDEAEGGERILVPEEADIRMRIPPRVPYGNKGTFGRVLIAAGAENMSGAAYLAALAAYRCGAGLVQILTPAANRIILQSTLPEAILTTYEGIPTTALIKEALGRADTVVLGPGIGQGEGALALVRGILASVRVPTVIDADALNLIAREHLPYPDSPTPLILTPHPGELSRLLGIPTEVLLPHLPAYAAAYADKHRLILVAKDARTVITDGKQTYLNVTGSSALAKGGSGDVLAGAVGALLAGGCTALDAALISVYIHGLAGEEAGRLHGTRGVLARETADCLSPLLE